MLVVRQIVILSLFLVAVSMVSAQTSPRTKTEKTSLSPASKPQSQPRSTTQSPRPADRPGTNTSATNRSDKPANTAAPGASATQNRLMPSPSTLRNSNGNRPATYTGTAQPGVTAKSGSKPVKKVAPLKTAAKVNVNWMTLEQALEKCKTEPRKIIVDVYTDWCGWCKHMDSTTFVDPAVSVYLNEHFYSVKFNAEQTQDISFKDKVYHFKKSGSRGHHELAAFWLNNRLSFPTVVFLDEQQNLIQPVPGYQDATKMEAIINYFGTDNHRKTPWESYEKNFVGRQR
ncbi:MAG: DUF255 domain-containing protein [Saprospiraceae bacterium]|nr:DUF255 domain-containing protein [Saprospiraceae bacterium]